MSEDGEALLLEIDRALRQLADWMPAVGTVEARRGLAFLMGALICLRRALAIGYTDALGLRTADAARSWAELRAVVQAAVAGTFIDDEPTRTFLAGLLFNVGVQRLYSAAEWADAKQLASSLRNRNNDLKHRDKRADLVPKSAVTPLIEPIVRAVMLRVAQECRGA